MYLHRESSDFPAVYPYKSAVYPPILQEDRINLITLLYQLSYPRHRLGRGVGLEPTTHGLTGKSECCNDPLKLMHVGTLDPRPI